ncbi:hypothetical protein [Streptomyces phytophilus]|uniref:hypothetical protein n=1 Tax=Streptomyces phytophilus TaxID=722715 RepID=UPI0015F10449|nr:hypothetical protein [Streptomyces phytophilus]
MSAAAELRAAAQKLRDLAEAATAGPWRSHDTHLDFGGHTATIMTARDDLNATELLAWLPTMSHEPWGDARNAWRNADFIAAMHPGVALALAAWLQKSADFCDQVSDVRAHPLSVADLSVVDALAVARALNPEVTR